MGRPVRQLLIALLAIVGLAGALLGPTVSASAVNQADADADVDTDKIAPRLERAFERSVGEPQDFWVVFDEAADTSGAGDIADWAERGAYVVDRLRETARDTQVDTVATLDAAGADYTSYWISNAIWVEAGDYSLALSLADRPEVERLVAPVTHEPPEPVKERLTGSRTGPNAVASVEWGVQNIKADQVWQQYGVRGDGIVVASIDSGVELDHPALFDSYRGYDAATGTVDHDYNWFDATGACDGAPCDGNGHGTHTMGTMVGDDGGANRIGVAPGVTWIAANGCDTCAEDDLLASAQWMLAPTRADGTDPDPAMRPNIINNSWGTTEPTNDPFIEDVLTAWADSGIFGVWSNGNLGRGGCATSGSPGSRALNYSIGAYDSTNTIADFSSRGPGQDGDVKPNISAPGVAVRSAWPGGQYASASGTSMAAPHTAGAIALLWSADAALIGDVAATRQLLDDTAVDTPDDQCGGSDDDNNVYGEGRLDALALVQATDQTNLGDIAGLVTDDESGAPVAGASIRLTAGDLVRSVRTDGDGAYAAAIPAGDYTAAVAAFGYESATVELTVTAEQTTTTDIQLTAAPGFTVSGKVVDKRTGRPMYGISVAISGIRDAVTTDRTGTFSLAQVPGPRSYTAHIDGGGCSQHDVYRTVDVSGDVQIPTVQLTRKTDATPFTESWAWGGPYGYSCVAEPSQWIRGDTEIDIPGIGHTTQVDLPFGFTYFGRTYHQLHVDGTYGAVGFWKRAGVESVVEGISAWTDLPFSYDDQARILSRTRGTGPNRTFTVEYRDVTALNRPDVRFSVEITLHEGGDFVLAYQGIDPEIPYERGDRASVEFQDHSPDGRLAHRTEFVYSHLEQVLDDSRQIRFGLPANGFLNGKVVDDQTGRPVADANVDLYDRFGKRLLRTTTGAAGRYRIQVFAGRPYEVAVLRPPGYQTPSRAGIRLSPGKSSVGLTTRLHSGRIGIDPRGLTLRPGKSATLTLTNNGTRRLDWRTGRQLPEPNAPAPGTELSSVPLRSVLAAVGIEEVDGSYWIAQGFAWGLIEVTAAGEPTGQQIDVDTIADALGIATDGLNAGDMAWIESRGWLCVSLLGGDLRARVSNIVCLDPVSGEVEMVIPTGFGPDIKTLAGLAYDAANDRFFVIGGAIGDGYQRRMRTLAGVEHTDPGAVLTTCTYPRLIQGLAWHPTTRSLWTNFGRTLLEVDPGNCAEISRLIGDYSTGGYGPTTGLDIEPDGDFVASPALPAAIATIRSGDRVSQRLPWLELSHAVGSLAPGAEQRIRVSVDWSAVPTGVTRATVVLRGNGGDRTKVTIPITLRR